MDNPVALSGPEEDRPAARGLLRLGKPADLNDNAAWCGQTAGTTGWPVTTNTFGALMPSVETMKPTTDDFAAMLADYEPAARGSGPKRGQMVKGTVVSISASSVFLDLGGKSEGVVEREELLDKEGELTVKLGDTVDGIGFQQARVRLDAPVQGHADLPGPGEGREPAVSDEGRDIGRYFVRPHNSLS